MYYNKLFQKSKKKHRFFCIFSRFVRTLRRFSASPAARRVFLKMSAVLRRRHSVHPFEGPGKVKTVVDSDRIADLVDRAVPELQKTRRLRVAHMQKILIRCAAGLSLEIPEKHILRQSRDPRQRAQIDLLVHIGV